MKTFNKCLFEERRKKGLTLKQASKLIGVPKFVLHNAEKGYYPLSKQHLKKASEIYEFNFEKLYDNTFAYTQIIKKDNDKTGKIWEKIYDISQKWFTKFVILLLLLICCASLGVHFFYHNKARYEPQFFVSKSYITLYSQIINNAQDQIGNFYIYNNNVTDGNKLLGNVTLTVKKALDPVEDFSFRSTYIISETSSFTLLNFSTLLVRQYFVDFLYVDENVEYTGSLWRYSETTYEPIKLYYQTKTSEKTQALPGSVMYNAITQTIAENFVKTDNLIKTTFEELGVKESVYKIVNGAINSENKIIKGKLMIPLYVSLATTLFFLILLMFSFTDKLKKYFNASGKNKLKTTYVFENCNKKKTYPKLPRDWKFFPPIKESWEQILGLIFLLCGGIGIVLSTFMSQGICGLQESESLKQIIKILLDFLPISIILLLYNKLDIYSKNNSIFRIVLMFLVFGVIFYAMQILTIATMQGNSRIEPDFYEIILYLLMPGNFFLGMALFATMALFLFTTPKKCKTQSKIRLWRLGSLIPILYFVVGYFVTYSYEIFGFTVSPYISCLFFSRDITITLFAFGSLLIKYFMQKKAYTLYGKEKGELYITGNRYTMKHNLYNVILLVILLCVDLVLPIIFNDVSKCGISGTLVLLLLIPLILLCAHKKEQRNSKGDVAYLVIYSILLILPYIVCVIATLNKYFNIFF